MIIKYHTRKLLKELNVKHKEYAKNLGISKQLLNYYLNKGDLTLQQIEVLAKQTEKTSSELIEKLNKKYIKTKI